MGVDVEAKHPEKNAFFEAVINKLQDYSQYTVGKLWIYIYILLYHQSVNPEFFYFVQINIYMF